MPRGLRTRLLAISSSSESFEGEFWILSSSSSERTVSRREFSTLVRASRRLSSTERSRIRQPRMVAEVIE